MPSEIRKCILINCKFFNCCFLNLLLIVHRCSFFIAVENYLRKAREQHRYSEEQALGMLLWHRHNLDSANADLPNFTQRPDDWLVEEQAIFRQGLVLYSKRFGEIQHQLLRERCVRELVEYYYTKYKLDRAHKLQLNQQKLFGTKSKRQHQWTTRRSHNTQNGHASSNWPGKSSFPSRF